MSNIYSELQNSSRVFKGRFPGKYSGIFSVSVQSKRAYFKEKILMQGYLLKSLNNENKAHKKINLYFQEGSFPETSKILTVVGTLYVSRNKTLSLYVKQWFNDSSHSKNIFMSKIVQLKNKLIKNLKYLHPDDYAMIQSTVFANKMALDKNIKKLFTNLGIGHLLVISGLHFVLILSMLKKVIFSIMFRFSVCVHYISYHGANFLFSTVIGGVYLMMIGCPVSACRAFLFIEIGQILDLLKIKASMFSVIFWTALCILCFDPKQVLELSFQFSFVCVLAIALFKSKDSSKWNTIQLSLGIFSMSQILTWYYFQVLHPLAWLNNLLLIPLFTVILSMYILFVIFCQVLDETYIEMFSQLIHSVNNLFIKLLNSLDQLGLHQVTIFSVLGYGFMLSVLLFILCNIYFKSKNFIQLMQSSMID